ncbi:MAG: CHAT domain-containing protein, partial [Cyanobacteria bacterium P01_C01_bin.72]
KNYSLTCCCITDITVDLETAAASGTGGISNIQQIIAGSGSNIIQGTSGDDVVTLSGLDTGIINDISFQGFETVLPGAGDDRFVVNGGPWVNLDGGAGFDTLDYGASNVGLTLDLENQSANNVAVFANIEGFLGSNHADTLQGTSGNDAISITGNNTGTLGSFTFSGIESINAGAGNDEVAIAAAGSLTGTLEAGTGVDRLDYSSYITDVTIDLENNTATAIGTLSNFEHIVGGSGNNDSLIGTINNDNITLTGIDAGTINAITFKGVENLDGQAGDDTFTVNNGASLTGTLSGGMGNDTANYTPYTTDITVDLQNDAATGISRFDTLESFIGGDGNDTFILNADDPTKEIDGGAGSNTLIGHDVVSIWNLTASNTGNGTGIENFSNIQNLIAGNQSDQINILADNAGFTGRLDGGAGLLKIIGDEINLGTDITGAGELILEPLSTDRDIQLGGVDSPSKLTLSLVELANISADFTAITIGSDKNTGMITLEADVTLPAPAKILAPQGNGIIDTQGFNLTAPELTLSAAQNITAGTLIAPSGITLNSGGAVITQDLLAAAAQNGGNIAIDAGTTITTEQIDTSTTGIKAGDVTLNAADTIQIQTIRAEGNTAGGNVTISTEQFLQVTDRFTNLDGQIASISTAATNGAGDITIHHGGNSNIPFKVGDSSLLGSHSAITSGTFQIEIENSFLNSYTLGNIAILTQDSLPSSIINQSSMVNLSTESTLVAIEPTSVIDFAATDFAVIDFAVIDSLSLDHLRAPTLNDNTNLNEVTASVNINDSNSALFEHLESSFSEQFKSHLNLYERVSISSPSLASAQKTLGNVEEFMDIKPGVLYIYFSPADKQQDASSDLNPNDELGLLLLTHTGQTIRRRVQGVTRSQVMATAEQFYAEVTNSISAPSQYLPPAQQLYSWFIAPVEDELQKQGVQSLAMAMDTGLRTLPVAALHNGQEYLVERYSLGVIPSFSLTDFNPQNFLYAQLENTQLLAMGASQFPSLQVLPAVPEELEIVTDNFHESEVFLNENFTLSNLQAQVARNKYGIVHLASHGVFKPGESRNSYIQLWDQPLQLNQVHTLGLQEANIALMVLSACNTALGDREAEYGFAGLAVNAGVQTSVASLWPISDEGTLGLMTYFYESLQRQPVRAQALQKAQLAMLRGNLQFRGGTLYGLNEEALAHFPELEYHGRWNFEHPFYWSTYTLVGSPW